MTVCVLLFFGGGGRSLRHLELFSGIAHELIEFSRAKWTNILTRQKTLEQAPVFQLVAAATRSPA